MDKCIEFSGYKDADGYGVISLKNTPLLAHRVAFKLMNPSINLTKNKDVCHKCDNPACINPEHLFLGTHGDNNRDRTAKGRSAKWESHGMKKLTTKQVIEIKRRRRLGEDTKSLADAFGVTRCNINIIMRGDSWKGVE